MKQFYLPVMRAARGIRTGTCSMKSSKRGSVQAHQRPVLAGWAVIFQSASGGSGCCSSSPNCISVRTVLLFHCGTLHHETERVVVDSAQENDCPADVESGLHQFRAYPLGGSHVFGVGQPCSRHHPRAVAVGKQGFVQAVPEGGSPDAPLGETGPGASLADRLLAGLVPDVDRRCLSRLDTGRTTHMAIGWIPCRRRQIWEYQGRLARRIARNAGQYRPALVNAQQASSTSSLVREDSFPE
jgi:hypothetical protein